MGSVMSSHGAVKSDEAMPNRPLAFAQSLGDPGVSDERTSGNTGVQLPQRHCPAKSAGSGIPAVLMHTLRRSAAIVASTPNYVESSAVLRTVKDRCRVIPYGIPAADFERVDPEAVQTIKDRYGPNIIVAVGRMVYYKGFKYLIRAMKNVRGRLLLVGAGPLKAELEAESRTVGDRVVFLEDVENVVPYLHAAEVFVLPSVARSEAFGIVQLEAMACGKPIVNTALDSGVTFVSVDKITGLTVPPEDSEALAAAITFLLEHPELRAKYGAAARDRVRRLFTVEAMAHSMLQLYGDLCDDFVPRNPGLIEDGALSATLRQSSLSERIQG